MSASVAFINGAFVTPSEARISLFDRGYLLGDGVFATLRGYDGRCFRARQHLRALRQGAEFFDLSVPMKEDELVSIANEAARRSQCVDAYVRVSVSRTEQGSTLSIIARPMDVPPEAAYEAGVHASMVTLRRAPPTCFPPHVKTLSYADKVLARRQAEGRGAFEGIQRSWDGAIAGGTMSNLFLVMDGALVTPALSSGCRPGVTREVVMHIAMAEGMRVIETTVDDQMLFAAKEAFLTSTRIECLPLRSIDERVIGSSGFPITRKLRQDLKDLIVRERSE